MKKLIVFIIGLLIVCSCGNVNRLPEQYVLPQSGRTVYVEKFDMDGHYYISYTIRQPLMNHYGFSVVHDPECPCNKSTGSE